MWKYAKDDCGAKLSVWPFDNPQSNYVILRGNPQASGRLDFGGANASYRIGIWSCTAGCFECTELGDELQTIISGSVIVTRVGGETIACGPGDSLFTAKGERLIWDIQVAVTKVFSTHNLSGGAN